MNRGPGHPVNYTLGSHSIMFYCDFVQPDNAIILQDNASLSDSPFVFYTLWWVRQNSGLQSSSRDSTSIHWATFKVVKQPWRMYENKSHEFCQELWLELKHTRHNKPSAYFMGGTVNLWAPVTYFSLETWMWCGTNTIPCRAYHETGQHLILITWTFLL